MRAELVLMGRRVDMARQARRRTLVMLIYAGMAGLMTAIWFIDHWRASGIWVYWAAMLACRLFLGGYYHSGLVKPFNNQPPRSARPPSAYLVWLRLYDPTPEDDPSSHNDERELAQRDRAHYLAYQAIAVALPVLWLFAYMGVVKRPWLQGVPIANLLYGLILTTLLLVFTLPQAILLWTEPDMEEDRD